MPANKANYLVVHTGESQVYATGKKEIALETPPPPGVELADKRVFFITYRPDDGVLSVHPLPQDEVLNAEIKYPKKKEKVDDQEAEA